MAVRNKLLNRWAKAVEACERKTCYDQEEAQHITDLRNVAEPGMYNTYRCMVCGCWHIGHIRKQPVQQQNQQKAS